MITLVYVSAACRLFDDAELADLLRVSRVNNLQRDITGMLCYADGNFMQAIEGPEDAVDTLEQTLRLDRRHRGMRRLIRQSVVRRQFADWSMALRSVGDLPAEEREGCVRLMHALLPARASDAPHPAIKLLESFRQTMS